MIQSGFSAFDWIGVRAAMRRMITEIIIYIMVVTSALIIWWLQ